MNFTESFSDEKFRLWVAFHAGFLESAEGYNGEMYYANPDRYDRQLCARFDEMYTDGRFDASEYRTEEGGDQ